MVKVLPVQDAVQKHAKVFSILEKQRYMYHSKLLNLSTNKSNKIFDILYYWFGTGICQLSSK